MSDLNRAQLVERAMFFASLATKAKEAADRIRSELEEQARAELESTGAAPTWRIPGVGTIPLALTQDTVDVVDEAAYRAYVATRYPDEVETVTQVRPAFSKQLREQAAKRGVAVDDEGTVIPGTVFRPGGEAKGISIRPAAPAKEASLELAEAFVDSLLMAELEVNGD